MIIRKWALLLLAVVFTNAASAKDALAVLPFSGGVGDAGENIAERFSFTDELSAEFVIIPRTSIARAIGSEQKFQTSTGMTDPDTIAAIGRQLGAQYVVTGKIARLGNRNLLIISILKIDDLRLIAGDVRTYSRIEEIIGNLPGMARNIIDATRTDKNSAQLEKLAVVPVTITDKNVDPQVADTLAQILSINFIRTKMYAVYPRTETLEQVQGEYATQLSGAVADEQIVDIGKAENPGLVLSVIARKLGTLNSFNATIMSLESGEQLVGRSADYKSLNDGVTAMENLARELTGVSTLGGDVSGANAKGGKRSGALGYGALNLALGLGSFIQGDPGGGFTILLSYGVGVGLIAWDVLAFSYKDDLAGIPGAVGFGVAGLAAIYGFIRPVVFNKNRALAEVIDRIDIAVVPRKDGMETVRLAYTIKF
jgi:TolB-like protein